MMHFLAEVLLHAREDGRVSARWAKWLDGHLEACSRCRETASRIRSTRDALATLPRAATPRMDWDRIERGIRERARTAPPRPAFVRPLGLVAAAAVLLAAILLVSRSEPELRRARTAPVPVARSAAEEPVRGIVTIVQGSVFARGPFDRVERRMVARSRVMEGTRMVTATRAAVAVQTSPSTGFRLGERSRAVVERLRRRELVVDLQRGEVASSVAALGDDASFVVKAGSISAHVKGTRFSVVHEEERIVVEVLEGVVDVRRHDESTSLRAPVKMVFESDARLARGSRLSAEVSADALSPAALNLRDEWPERLASLHVPGPRGAGGDVHVDGTPLGSTPLLVLRPPGPATVEVINEGIAKRFVVDVQGFDVEPGPAVEAHVPPSPEPAVGRLEQSLIKRVIQSHTADVRRCYERRLKRDPRLRDRVVMEFTIGSDGQVTAARARAGATDPDIVSCLETAVRSWTFDRPEGGAVRVVYPLSFAPAGAE